MMMRLPISARRTTSAMIASPRNWASSMPMTSVRKSSRFSTSAALLTVSEWMRVSLWETIWLFEYLWSSMGLKICTRWRAISARRRRRISSSLLPLNMGPQITSIQPRFPRIAFILVLLLRHLFRSRALCPGLPHIFVKLVKTGKHFRGAAQQPAAHLLHRHGADQIDRNAQPVREGQLALRARAASGVLVPVADNRIALMLDQVKIKCNDLAYGLLEARQVALLPRTKLAHLGLREVLLFIQRRIVKSVPQQREQQ